MKVNLIVLSIFLIITGSQVFAQIGSAVIYLKSDSVINITIDKIYKSALIDLNGNGIMYSVIDSLITPDSAVANQMNRIIPELHITQRGNNYFINMSSVFRSFPTAPSKPESQTKVENPDNDHHFIRAFGLKAGYINSFKRFDESSQNDYNESFGSIWGPVVGAFLETNFFPPYISLTAEFQFLQRGYTETYFFKETNRGMIEIRNTYLSISWLAKLRFANRIVIPYLSFGPRYESNLTSVNNKRGGRVVAGMEISLGNIPTMIIEINYDINYTYSLDTVEDRSIGFLVGVSF